MNCYKRCYFRHWAQKVTDIHGVKHAAGDGGIVRRLIWSVATLAATTMFLIQVTLTLISYFNWNYIVRVDVNHTTRLDFPAFTVCNFNKYREFAISPLDLKNTGTHLGKFQVMGSQNQNISIETPPLFSNSVIDWFI